MRSVTAIKTLMIAVIGLTAGFTGFRQYEASQLVQPYEFNHVAHRIMDCTRCHEGAVDGILATLPSMEICLKCHTGSPYSGPSETAVWDDAVSAGGFRWNKLTSVPGHVFFSHRQHTKLKDIPCERCHADMKDMTRPPSLPLMRISMDLCIDCHNDSGATEDCAHCHK